MIRDAFTRAYLEAVEFTDIHDDNPELVDAEGFSPEFLEQARQDCRSFQDTNSELLEEAYRTRLYDERLAGIDFWLTRNGHGAGFWDRGLGELGDKLTDAAHGYGGVDLYAGDDGLIYGT